MFRNRMTKRILAFTLCAMLVAGMIPESILAAEAGESTEAVETDPGKETAGEAVSDNKTAPDTGNEIPGDDSEGTAPSENEATEPVEDPSGIPEETMPTETVSEDEVVEETVSENEIPPEEVDPGSEGEEAAGASSTVYFSVNDNVLGMWLPKTGSLEFYNANGTNGGALNIDDSNSSASWRAYLGKAKQIVIGDGITKVGDNAFYGYKNINKVIFNSYTLKTIGKYSFSECGGITEVDFKDRTSKLSEIGEGAFSHCSSVAGSVALPDSVTSLGKYAFYRCAGLEEVSIAGVGTITGYSFAECRNLKKVICSSGLKAIEKYAFYNSYHIKEFHKKDNYSYDFEIPLGCADIGERAFSYDINSPAITNELTPSNVRAICIMGAYDEGNNAAGKIGAWAFAGFEGKYDTYDTDGKKIYSCRAGSVLIGDGVREIGAYAFSGAGEFSTYKGKYLLGHSHVYEESTRIGKNVEIIGEGAFYNNFFSRLDRFKVDISYEDVRCIPTPIIIPKSVKKIGAYAFYNCLAGGLEFEMDDDGTGSSLEEIGEYAFAVNHGKRGYTYYPFTNSNLCDYPEALDRDHYWTGGYDIYHPLKECGWFGPDRDMVLKPEDGVVFFPKSLKKIGYRAFYENYALTGISFMGYDAGLQEIGEEAFAYCDLSDRLDYLPSSLEKIGDKAFYDTAISGTIHLENTKVEYVGMEAFMCEENRNGELKESLGNSHGGSTFTTVNFPSTLKGIGHEAFKGSRELQTLNFAGGGQNLQIIGHEAFYFYANDGDYSGKINRITGLQNNHIYNISGGAFQNNPGITEFYLGDGLQLLYKDAFKNTSLKNISIPGTLKTVSGAFPDTLENVTIGQGVEEITELTYTNSYVKHGSSHEFNLYVPTGVKKIGKICVDPSGVSNFMSQQIVISLPAGIEDLNFLDVYYSSDGTPTIANSRASFKKIIFRGTEEQWKIKMHDNSIEQYKADFLEAYDGNYETAPEIECTGSSTSGGTEGYCGKNLTFSLNGSTLTIAGSGPMYDFEEGRSPWAGKTINTISFPTNNLFSIGAYAFNGVTFGSDAKNINLSTCTAVREGAFKDCTSLQKISFSKDMNSISVEAFKNCTGLQSITFPENVDYIGPNAFEGCTGLTGVTLPNISSLSDSIFKDCTGLLSADCTRVITAGNRNFVGPGWFKGCTNLASVKMAGINGTNEIFIQKGAFERCIALKSIDSAANGGLVAKGNTHIESGAFKDSGINSVNITGGTLDGASRILESGAFENCESLTSVTLSRATTLPMSAFSGCTALASINMPNVTSIPEEAFRGCTGLTAISFPNAASIGDQAFYGCSNLTTADISGLTAIPYGLFADCTKLADLTVRENGLTTIGDYAFLNCKALPMSGTESLCKQGNLKKIGYGAFKGCDSTNFKKVSFTALTSMGREAFRGCTNLQNVSIGGIGSIPHSAFRACTKLSTVNLTGVTKLEENSFSGCNSLTTINSTDGLLKTIGYRAFDGAGFTTFTIPAGVKEIGREAFYSCAGLQTVDFRNTTGCALDYGSFMDCTGLTTVLGSTKLSDFGMSAFKGCTSLQAIELNPSLDKVPAFAFDSSGLKNIVIPANVKSIESYAYNDVDPDTIIFNGTIAQWRKVAVDYYTTGTDTGNKCFVKKVIQCTDGKFGYCGTDGFGIKEDNTYYWHADDLNWSLSNDGTLEIHGKGNMDIIDSHSTDHSPWNKNEIKTIIVGGNEGDDVGSIEPVFKNLPNLTTATLALAVWSSSTSIQGGAFAGCPKLQKVTINSGEKIGMGAFENCTALTTVSINMSYDDPDSHPTQDIGKGAFKGCTALKNVTIADGLDHIGVDAFNGCTALTTVKIPHTVESGDYYDFDISGTSDNIGTGAFTDCGGSGGLTIIDDHSGGVTQYLDKLSPAERAKITRIDETGEKMARLNKGTITLDLTNGDTALDAQKTAVLLNSLYSIAGVTTTDQGLRVDFDPDDPSMTSNWWKADDISISLAEDGSSFILPLERDDYFVEDEHGTGTVNEEKAYRLALQDKEYYSKVIVSYPATITVEKYAVSFDANGGSGSMSANMILKGSWYTLPYPSFKAPKNMEFDRWDKGEPTDKIYITGDTVLKALWKQHTHDLTHFEGKDASCKWDGNHEYYYCSICEKYFSDSEARNEVPEDDVVIHKNANAHSFNDWIITKEPTDMVPGEKYRTCSICGNTQTKDIPVTTHVHGSLTFHQGYAATCVAEGERSYYQCSCGYKFFDDQATEEVEGDNDLVIPVDLNAHDFTSGTVTKAPTCTTEGEKTYVCSRDTKHIRIDPVPALGHDWDEWEIIKEPTATTPGIRRHICKRDKTHVGEETIPTTGGEAPPASLDGWQVSFDEREINKGSDGTYSLTYTGAALKPTVTVWHNGTLLIEGTDYSVKYSGNTNCSEKGAEVTVTGKGIYSGTQKLQFMVAAKNISDPGDPDISIGNTLIEKGKTADPTISYMGNQLKKGSDYTLALGTGEVTLTGKGNFTGNRVVKITELEKKELKKRSIKVTMSKVSRVYDTKEQKLTKDELKVTDADNNDLEIDRDYSVSYSQNVDAGTVKVTVVGLNDYCGTVKKSFKISPARNAVIEVKTDKESYSFVKSGVRPSLSVNASLADGTKVTLKEGRDYTVKFTDNKKVGYGKFELSFRRNYRGAKYKGSNTFEITKAKFDDTATVIAPDMVYKRPGTYHPKVFVIAGESLLGGGDVVKTYDQKGKLVLENGQTESFNVNVKVKDGRNSKFEDGTGGAGISRTYSVTAGSKKIDVSKAKVGLIKNRKAVKSVPFTGKEVRFPIKDETGANTVILSMKIGKTALVQEDIEKNFDIIYADNVEKGKATVILLPKADSQYTGAAAGTFMIGSGLFGK